MARPYSWIRIYRTYFTFESYVRFLTYAILAFVHEICAVSFAVSFTARCYTEGGYATVNRLSASLLSVHPSVTFRYVFSRRLEYFEIISRPISVRFLPRADPNIGDLVRLGNNPQIQVE